MEMDSLVPKAKDVEDWSSMGRVSFFFFFSLFCGGFGTGKKARMFSINSDC